MMTFCDATAAAAAAAAAAAGSQFALCAHRILLQYGGNGVCVEILSLSRLSLSLSRLSRSRDSLSLETLSLETLSLSLSRHSLERLSLSLPRDTLSRDSLSLQLSLETLALYVSVAVAYSPYAVCCVTTSSFFFVVVDFCFCLVLDRPPGMSCHPNGAEPKPSQDK